MKVASKRFYGVGIISNRASVRGIFPKSIPENGFAFYASADRVDRIRRFAFQLGIVGRFPRGHPGSIVEREIRNVVVCPSGYIRLLACGIAAGPAPRQYVDGEQCRFVPGFHAVFRISFAARIAVPVVLVAIYRSGAAISGGSRSDSGSSLGGPS